MLENWLPGLGMDRGAFTIQAKTEDGLVVIAGRGEWDHRAEESSANARLIAAAPELLAAARRALGLLEMSGTGKMAKTPAGMDLRSAIAKAEGTK